MINSVQRHSIICIFALITYFNALPVLADPALWKIEGQRNNVYLFGSIHVANESMYPLGEKIESAFNQSQVLVVEVDELKVDQVKLQQLITSRGFYEGTDSIKNHVTKETFSLLQSLLVETQIPYVTVARMKPGIIALTLTVAKIMKMGYSPDLGIDRYFMNRARGEKEIQQLETTEAQINLLLTISDDNLLLQHTLTALDKLPVMIADLVTAWSKGDDIRLTKLMLTDQVKEHPEFADIIKILIEDRNVSMASKIKQFAESNKNYFVVVGAGHLVGEKGIVSLLMQKGLKVQRL